MLNKKQRITELQITKKKCVQHFSDFSKHSARILSLSKEVFSVQSAFKFRRAWSENDLWKKSSLQKKSLVKFSTFRGFARVPDHDDGIKS